MSDESSEALAGATARDQGGRPVPAETDPTDPAVGLEDFGGEDQPDDEDDESFSFTPVQLRFRRDGWTAERQEHFIRALAETACVESACRQVGMSSTSVYKLRANPDAHSFRIAWESALDLGVSRLSDAALSRAIYGVPIPHFHNGEQVGEHRRYDERLTMWMLRYRDPVRYGKWLDRRDTTQNPEGPAMLLRRRIQELIDDCFGFLTRRFPLSRPAPDDREG